MKLNRIHSKGGKKVSPAQSANALKSSPGKPQSSTTSPDKISLVFCSERESAEITGIDFKPGEFEAIQQDATARGETLSAWLCRVIDEETPRNPPEETVFIQLIDRFGGVVNDLAIPLSLYNSLRPGQSSSVEPAAALPAQSVILGPMHETQHKSTTATVELSHDVATAIDGVGIEHKIQFKEAFRLCLLLGARALASEKAFTAADHQLWNALGKIEGIQNEMNFFVQSVRAAMATWSDEGSLPKDDLDRQQVGFLELWRRLDDDARLEIAMACEAARQLRDRSIGRGKGGEL